MTDYESLFNDQLKNIDDQFKAIAAAFNDSLNCKKNAVIEMHRKDPRKTRHDALVAMRKILENFEAIDVKKLLSLEIDETVTIKITKTGKSNTN